MTRKHWERACRIHIVAIPEDNDILNTFFDTEDYENFSSKRFNTSGITEEKSSQRNEAIKILKTLYEALTVSDRNILKCWKVHMNEHVMERITTNCSDYFYTIITKYRPIDYYNIPTYLFNKINAFEQDILFQTYEVECVRLERADKNHLS